ncbi:hypothetical protein D3C77_635460 [compost metagenome]
MFSLRSPWATVPATRTAWFKGWTMLRVNITASNTVSTAASTIATITPSTAFSYTSVENSVDASAPCTLIALRLASAAVMASA